MGERTGLKLHGLSVLHSRNHTYHIYATETLPWCQGAIPHWSDYLQHVISLLPIDYDLLDIASAWLLTVANYFLVSRYDVYLDKYNRSFFKVSFTDQVPIQP